MGTSLLNHFLAYASSGETEFRHHGGSIVMFGEFRPSISESDTGITSHD